MNESKGDKEEIKVWVENKDERMVSKGNIGCYAPIRADGIKAKEAPLLQIELDNINSIPRVFYKGEEIKNKLELAFEWETTTPVSYNPAYVRIKHWDKEGGKRTMNSKTIQHNEPIW